MSKKEPKGVKPSQYKAKPVKAPLINKIPTKSKADDIPEDEKLRLIDQTGLLKKVKKRETELATEYAIQQTTTGEYIWQAIFLSIPFGFLMATFDVTVKVQYSEPWDYTGMAIKCIKSAPALAPFIYLTNKHKTKKTAQILMSFASVFIGSLLMYTLRHSPSLGQMMRAPGLATAWIYLVIQLDLIPAVVTLALVFSYWYFGLQA